MKRAQKSTWGDYIRAGAQRESDFFNWLEIDAQVFSVVFDEVQPGRQLTYFQSQCRDEALWYGTRFRHLEDTVAKVSPHQVGAKQIPAKQHRSAGAVAQGNKKCPGVAATGPDKYRGCLFIGCDDFTDSVASAIGARRTEHHFALEEHRLRPRIFPVEWKREGLIQLRSCNRRILEDSLHVVWTTIC